MATYTEQELISFGNYLLSKERAASILNPENLNSVGDWDVANWKEKEGVSSHLDQVEAQLLAVANK